MTKKNRLRWEKFTQLASAELGFESRSPRPPPIKSTKPIATHNEKVPPSQTTCIQAVRLDQDWRGRRKRDAITEGFTEKAAFELSLRE